MIYFFILTYGTYFQYETAQQKINREILIFGFADKVLKQGPRKSNKTFLNKFEVNHSKLKRSEKLDVCS